MKRVIWIWLAEDATEAEEKYWDRFIRVNMKVSEDVRFLIAETLEDLEKKASILEKMGWSCERSGNGLMDRILYFIKEDVSE